jgi:hypothetical protein
MIGPFSRGSDRGALLACRRFDARSHRAGPDSQSYPIPLAEATAAPSSRRGLFLPRPGFAGSLLRRCALFTGRASDIRARTDLWGRSARAEGTTPLPRPKGRGAEGGRGALPRGFPCGRPSPVRARSLQARRSSRRPPVLPENASFLVLNSHMLAAPPRKLRMLWNLPHRGKRVTGPPPSATDLRNPLKTL